MVLEDKIIKLLREYERLSKKEIRKLILRDARDYAPIDSILKDMKRDKRILKDRLGRYYLKEDSFKREEILKARSKSLGSRARARAGARKNAEIKGRIALVKNKYAFFEGEDGQKLYIPAEKLMGAMLNDRVAAIKTGGAFLS